MTLIRVKHRLSSYEIAFDREDGRISKLIQMVHVIMVDTGCARVLHNCYSIGFPLEQTRRTSMDIDRSTIDKPSVKEFSTGSSIRYSAAESSG